MVLAYNGLLVSTIWHGFTDWWSCFDDLTNGWVDVIRSNNEQLAHV